MGQKFIRLFLAIILFAPDVWAQGIEDERFLSDEDVVSVKERPNKYYNALGVSMGTFLFRPGIEVEGRHDDNIFRASTNEQDDFVTEVKPSAVLASNWSRHALNARVEGSFAAYTDNEDENYNDYSANINGRYDIAHETFLTGGIGYQNLHEERSDPDDVRGDEPTEFDVLSVQAGVARQLAKLRARADIRYRDVEFDNASVGSTVINNADRNREQLDYIGRLGYELSPNYEAYAQYTFTDVNYDQLTNGVDRSSDGHEILLGTELNLTGKAKGEIYVGYATREFSAGLEDVDMPRFGGSLLWNVTGLTSLKAEANRRVFETISQNASSYIRTDGEIGIEHALKTNIILDASAGLMNDEFQGNGRDDDTVLLNVGAEYRPFRGGSLEGGYRYTDRESNFTGGDYETNRFFLTLGYIY